MIWFFIFEAFFYLILFIVLIGCIYTFWLTLKHPPYVPTVNPKVVGSIKNYLDEHPEVQTFVEPGSGFCGVSLTIEKAFSNLEIVAIEYNFFIYILAKMKLSLINSKIKLYNADFTNFDLGKVSSLDKNIKVTKILKSKTLIYCYLLPELLGLAFKKGQFKDSVVMTLDFQIPNQIADQNILIGQTGGFQKQLWVYNFSI